MTFPNLANAPTLVASDHSEQWPNIENNERVVWSGTLSGPRMFSSKIQARLIKVLTSMAACALFFYPPKGRNFFEDIIIFILLLIGAVLLGDVVGRFLRLCFKSRRKILQESKHFVVTDASLYFFDENKILLERFSTKYANMISDSDQTKTVIEISTQANEETIFLLGDPEPLNRILASRAVPPTKSVPTLVAIADPVGWALKKGEEVRWTGELSGPRVFGRSFERRIFQVLPCALLAGSIKDMVKDGSFSLEKLFFGILIMPIIAVLVVGWPVWLYIRSRREIERESKYLVVTDNRMYFFDKNKNLLENFKSTCATIGDSAQTTTIINISTQDTDETLKLQGDPEPLKRLLQKKEMPVQYGALT